MTKDYIIKCPNCGFEFSLLCDEQEFEEIKEEILRCPCGNKAEITNEREVRNDKV